MDDKSAISDSPHGDTADLEPALVLEIDLQEDVRVLWETFSHLRLSNRGPEAHEFMASLLETLRDGDETVRQRFARECCRIAFTTETPFPVTHRLLVEIMLPYLADAIANSVMPDMIWVVEAKRLLFDEFVEKHIGPVSNFHLLKKALKLEPNHPRAARLMLEDLMYILEYNSQDMPAGYSCEDIEIERTLQLLAQALDIAAAGATPEERIFFMKHKRLFEAWRKYQAVSPAIDFGEWCRRAGVCMP